MGRAMSVRVSVIVPVYNGGELLDTCVESLRRQSLSTDAWEAIFVDDGSTDGTGERLDRLADEMANIRVIRTPNSGWPGRPRNLGLDVARGAYVLFLDHDDWLGDEALERLSAMADAVEADVVVGREVGHGRRVPRELFRRNVVDARIGREPLLRLMTPHKLFRRSLLEAHRIRFPEGRRRFEDHVFVLRAFFASRRTAILADYPCYHWVTRADGQNASDQYEEPDAYYAALRDVLEVVDEHVEAGPERDAMVAHWYRRRGLDRLAGARWADGPAAHDQLVFDAVRELALERMTPSVVASLPLSHRLRSSAVSEDRPELVAALAQLEHGARARLAVERLELQGSMLHVGLAATLYDGLGQPMRFRRSRDGRIRWLPGSPLPGLEGADLEATADVGQTIVSVVIRGADGSDEHDAPADVQVGIDGDRLRIDAEATVDLRDVAGGTGLAAGEWQLLAEVSTCGWRSLRRIRPPGAARGATARLVHTDSAGWRMVAKAPTDRPADGPRRRRGTRHPLERLVPRAVLSRLPVALRVAAKRLVMRADASRT
jgi:glycosyltransferase involved in cell wall biosynthesis